MRELQFLFQHLEKTGSRNLKMFAINSFRDGMGTMASRDLDYCLEVLDGRWKTGYTYYKVSRHSVNEYLVKQAARKDLSLEEFLRPVFNPYGRDEQTIRGICRDFRDFQDFIEPLVNRKWRLGIGKSLLSVKEASPMLAKKYDSSKIPPSKEGYYITEKLDGNRCIAQWVEEQGRWVFTSRSGKELRVQFDMREMPKEHIYDGEILSRKQLNNPGQANFNTLSGAVNSKYGDKNGLLYVIFDLIITGTSYAVRRDKLEKIETALGDSADVRILPVLQYCSDVKSLEHAILYHLDSVTSVGGEGLMVNIGSRNYEPKRTDALLKVKLLQTMDMKVTELFEGTGKHEGRVGALNCICKSEGKVYECRVGTGLSDDQREFWANNPEEILDKIVEVAYFSVSQDKQARGTNSYSLRFPRLKRVRNDKKETSEY